MFTVNIESYGDILLYFCGIRNMNKYLILVYMAHVNKYKLDKYDISMSINLTNMISINGYKLEKYGPSQWYKLDKYSLTQWVIIVDNDPRQQVIIVDILFERNNFENHDYMFLKNLWI